MPVYFDQRNKRWRFEFDRKIGERRHRATKLLPKGWTAQQADEYARGGYKVEETIYRVTTVIPSALLDCGHWRQERNCGTVISTAKRLECFECLRLAREQAA